MKSITIYGCGISDKIRVHTIVGGLNFTRHDHIYIAVPFIGQSINGVSGESLKRFLR